MTLYKNISQIVLIAITTVFSQNMVAQQDTIKKPEIKISYLDSIKSTFVKNQMATKIDSLWMKDITSLSTYNTMIEDIKNFNIDQKVDYDLSTDLLKERLKKLDEKSPFHIEYNIGLENVIKSFLKNRKKTFERLLGLSEYYFPLFEDQLGKNNIPLEIKYLAVVESALRPDAKSRVNATGLWQFMYETGKNYSLKINSYVDERSDPLRSSQAASEYLYNMYKIFGDWDLVLAAYNSGPGNVAKAIRRSGGQQNYWNIRKNLPRETQGYLPAFLATMYIFEYHKEHGIVPDKAVANLYATDTIMVKNHISFKQISELLDIPVSEVKFFNPSYLRNEIPHVSGEQNFLRLPKDKIAVFTSNEDKIYTYTKHEENLRERPTVRIAVAKVKDTTHIGSLDKMVNRTKYHKVRRGENLDEIAEKYNVSVAQLKLWNQLRSDVAPRGRNLKIISSEEIAYKNTTEKPKQISDSTVVSTQNKTAVVVAQPKIEKVFKTEKVIVNKDITKNHKVKKGDNITEIADQYDVSVADIKKWNHLKGNTLAKGKNLKIIVNEKVATTVKKEIQIPVKTENEVAVVDHKKTPKTVIKNEEKLDTNSKTDSYYVVAKGDNLFSIAKKNSVSVDNLKNWNNIIDNTVKVGTQLVVSNAAIQDVKNSKNDVKITEYIVAKGDNLMNIAKRNNTTIDELKQWNNLSGNNVHLGDKLIVFKNEIAVKDTKNKKNDFAANDKKATEKLYQVKKGDTLYTISKKFPGVTIADIKKWNNIKSEDLQPGMKLKING